MFDLTKDLTLKDSCPCKISTSIFPFLVVLNLLFANLVIFFFLEKLFFKVALIGCSSVSPQLFSIKGITKNLKQADDDIGFPGSPKIAFCFPLILPNNIGFPGRIATLLK
mgnify:CR=1 FL=1